MKYKNSGVSSDSFTDSVHVRVTAGDTPDDFESYAVFDDVTQVSEEFVGRHGKRGARRYARGYAEAKVRYTDG
jgi:hypothetical protein